MTKLELFEDIYLEELKDLYDAENQLLKAIPKLAQAAFAEELKEAFNEHAEVTRQQLQRLESVFKKRGEAPKSKPCKAMAGLVAEAEELLKKEAEPEVRDVGLITAAQKVEHYEIAGYGCTATYAKLLGFEEEARLLRQTLAEEKETDGKLTYIAENIVNEEAAQGEKNVDDTVELETENQVGGQGTSARQQASKVSGKGGRSTKGEQSEGGTDDHSAHETTVLEEIRGWAEARGGKPATVKGTGGKNDAGLLRIDFPNYSGEQSLEEISWEDWYEKFKESKLVFLYQEQTKDGQQSRFFKLIRK